MERTSASIEDHLAAMSGPQGVAMRLLHAEITERMPDEEAHLYEGRFWGGSDQKIIGYGIVDRQNRSGEHVEWFLVGLAAQKNHMSVYVNAVSDGAYLLRQYEDRLGKAKVGSASIGFKTLDDVEFDTLLDLIEEAAKTGST